MNEETKQVILNRIEELKKESDEYQQRAIIQLNAKVSEYKGRIQALKWAAGLTKLAEAIEDEEAEQIAEGRPVEEVLETSGQPEPTEDEEGASL